MSAVFDLQARKASFKKDKDSITRDFCDGLSALQSQASGWPFRHIKQSDLDGAERNLLVLRAVLSELRGHVPFDDNKGAA